MSQAVMSFYPIVKGMENYCRVTLIDDDPISHLINTRLIGYCSTCQVETFLDPTVALKELQDRMSNDAIRFPDIIFLDIDMPKMDGWQFLDEFQKLPESRHTTVIMLSSSNHTADIQKAKTYKVVKHFFSKPLTEDKIRMVMMSRTDVHK